MFLRVFIMTIHIVIIETNTTEHNDTTIYYRLDIQILNMEKKKSDLTVLPHINPKHTRRILLVNDLSQNMVYLKLEITVR